MNHQQTLEWKTGIKADHDKAIITSRKEFITKAHDKGYMTITKPYGLLAQANGKRVGEFMTEGPKGPIDKPTGYLL